VPRLEEQSQVEAGSNSKHPADEVGRPVFLTFWIVYKSSADRPYVYSSPPSRAYMDKWRADGYKIYSITTQLPEYDYADGYANGLAKEVTL
jgi:hypothetical protein